MKRLAFLLPVIVAALLVHSWWSGRVSEPLRFRTTISFLRDGARQTAAAVNSLTAARHYHMAPGITGWISQYRLSGVAIAMPATGGHLIALLDEQAGMAIAFSQGKKIESGFSEGWPLAEAWIDAWNRLALSDATNVMSPTIHPRLFFLPEGGRSGDGRLVGWEQSAEVGVLLEEATVQITRDPVTPTPPLFAGLGCTGAVDLDESSDIYGWDPPTCSSLVFRGLEND